MHSRQLSFSLFLPFVFVLLFAAVAFSLRHAPAQQFAATYIYGKLSVTIPYRSTHEGTGKLAVEILDPEDNVLGRIERPADIGEHDLRAFARKRTGDRLADAPDPARAGDDRNLISESRIHDRGSYHGATKEAADC